MDIPKTFSLGAIGHHPKMPLNYIKHYGRKVVSTDRKYTLVKWILRNLDPFFYLAKWKTDRIIGINSSVQTTLRLKKEKCTIIPAAATEDPTLKEKGNDIFNILSVGRFTPMKGVDISILAFCKFYKDITKKT